MRKTNIYRRTKVMFALCLVMVLSISCVSFASQAKQKEDDTQTVSDEKLSFEEYQKILSKKVLNWGSEKVDSSELYFTLHDIDHDGISELFVAYPEGSYDDGTMRIYTYNKKKKKRQLICKTSDQVYVYEKDAVVCLVAERTGSNTASYRIFKNGKLEKQIFMTGTTLYDMIPMDCGVLEVAPGDGETIYFYEFEADGQPITLEEAKEIVTPLERGNVMADLGKYYKNTKKNRNKLFSA